MKIFIFLFTVFVFLKTLFYGLYEIKNRQNRFAGYSIIVISFICLLGPNIIMYIQ